MAQQPAYESYLQEHEAEHLEQLFEFLRIPSVSSIPEHAADVRRAAEWLAQRLRDVGVPRVELLETTGNPVVYGEWIVDPDKPTAIIYGHYDVQPPDPLELWVTPPFEPSLRDERIYARGASDDKGNLFMPVKALEALVQTQGAPPINLKFTFEGEEEIGSPSLPAFIQDHRELLAADFAICADGPMWGPDAPSLTTATKGLAGCQVNVRTAATDMHSGIFGASVRNAVQAAIQLAATLHDAEGRVAVEGFYDRVIALTEQERGEFAEVPFDTAAYLANVGASDFWGEPGYTPVERNWARPTLDLNGFWGGFQGPGTKTVTPCEAHFKITCRLVSDQNPEEILDLLEAHLARHTPAATTVEVQRMPGSARPFHIRRDHPALMVADEVLGNLYDRDPYVIRLGGTLPIAEVYQNELGASMIFYSWSMPDSRGHAPNENYPLSSFRMARRGYCAFLNRLAEIDKSVL